VSFALLAISFFSGLPAASISFMLMIEIMFIFLLSLGQKETLFRKFLWFLGIVLIVRMVTVDYNIADIYWNAIGLKHSLTVFFFSGILFYIMGNIMQKREPEEKITPNESGIYACTGFTLGALGIISGCSPANTSLYLIGEMILIFTLGLVYREPLYRKYVWFMSVFIFFRLLAFDYGKEDFYYFLSFAVKHDVLMLGVSSLVFYIGGALIKIIPSLESRLEPGEGEVYTYSGIYPAILLAFLLYSEVSPQWLTVNWALEGIAFLLLGFLLNRKPDRISSLVILSFALLRLIFIDIAGLETVYKFLAFIILGAILLIASMVYSRFMAKKGEDAKEPPPPK